MVSKCPYFLIPWCTNASEEVHTHTSVENSYRPRLPVLGLGDLLPEAGSHGGRAQKSVSQLLFVLHDFITTQTAVEIFC